MKTAFIQDEIYSCHFFLVWDCSWKEWTKFLEQNFGYSVGDNPKAGDGETFADKDGIIHALWHKNVSFAKYPHFDLDHELVHFIARNLRVRGINLERSTEESYAYYFCYLKRKIWKELFPPRKKKLKKKK